jgi:putative nucleotidyltransferase with HDIG domain
VTEGRSNQPAISIDDTVEALSQALRVWDAESYEHCRRTAVYAERIAAGLGLDGGAIREARIGALLHDIGKMGVDLDVLRKPARLDEHEAEHVHMHPSMGASILAKVLPQPIVDCAEFHHEQPDGHGYPHGLGEAEIPLGALICRVADVLDSLTTEQSYRPAMPLADALAELREGGGSRYSASVVGADADALELAA